jgi:hypothetical protein
MDLDRLEYGRALSIVHGASMAAVLTMTHALGGDPGIAPRVGARRSLLAPA